MLYIPDDKVFFPEHRYKLVIKYERDSSCETFDIPLNHIPEIRERLLKRYHVFEIEYWSFINTKYVSSADFITEVALSNKFPEAGWHYLDKETLDMILSEKGQKILMAQSMKVETDECFKKKTDLTDFMKCKYAGTKLRKSKDTEY